MVKLSKMNLFHLQIEWISVTIKNTRIHANFFCTYFYQKLPTCPTWYNERGLQITAKTDNNSDQMLVEENIKFYSDLQKHRAWIWLYMCLLDETCYKSIYTGKMQSLFYFTIRFDIVTIHHLLKFAIFGSWF